ncbi:glucoamylase family protein [Novacetimonas cocois]|uniref:Tat pathway signal protein n=1 Tax=Novacetimonas cocois TaxID=1747507 RepID=A0A365YWT4_9PROT|nr:glucoamylase family protein [Novacetimonas cocois]RBM07474.1 Tat pathway signal protein [Novacetimonas cocois]
MKSSTSHNMPVATATDAALIDDLEHRTFQWFWDAADPASGLVPDRYPSAQTQASVASIGFGLTAYGIGATRGYITRDQAVARTISTLRYLLRSPQNDSEDNATGYQGLYYHFLRKSDGLRLNHDIELSSIDTALLMQGVLFSQSFYDRDTPQEREIRDLSDQLYRRVNWRWIRRPDNRLSMGWSPEHQFIASYWEGYSEGMMAYILGLGSPTFSLEPTSWQAWLATNDRRWGDYYGQTFLNFAPLFGHQYSHAWIDFRGIQDDWAHQKQIDYFENSRRAVYAQRAYAIANPGKWRDYGPTMWGLTACDGPGETTQQMDGQARHFLSYSARGAGRDYTQDDGTIAPTAAVGSIAFAPEIVLPTLHDMKARYGSRIYGKYGFVDAFNPSFRDGKSFWSDNEYLGIDQGPILLMIENWRTGLVWNVMKRNPYIRTGLQRAGFQGGWLSNSPAPARVAQAMPLR